MNLNEQLQRLGDAEIDDLSIAHLERADEVIDVVKAWIEWNEGQP